MSDKKKRKRFTLEDKYRVIQMMDKNVSTKVILDHFQEMRLTANNIYEFRRQRQAIIDAFESSISTSKKSIQGSRYRSIDQKLLDLSSKRRQWFTHKSVFAQKRRLNLAENMVISSSSHLMDM